jgi:hypothetical protein
MNLTRKELELVIQFDRELEAVLLAIKHEKDFQEALKISNELPKKLSLKNSFAMFLADLKASRDQ